MQKKLLSLFSILIIGLLASPNVNAWRSRTGTDSKTARQPLGTIQVYEGASLNRPFMVIGRGRVKSSTLSQLVRYMQSLALRQGGNAVLKYSVQNSAQISYWTGGQLSYAEGIIVKYDPNGIKSITDKTIIPVIQ